MKLLFSHIQNEKNHRIIWKTPDTPNNISDQLNNSTENTPDALVGSTIENTERGLGELLAGVDKNLLPNSKAEKAEISAANNLEKNSPIISKIRQNNPEAPVNSAKTMSEIVHFAKNNLGPNSFKASGFNV